MKNLNQIFKLPVLGYNFEDKEKFEYTQLQKLSEEIHEYRMENDRDLKICELFDVIQVTFSLLELFTQDEIDNAYRLNLKKHEERNIFPMLGKYEIFKLMKK